MAFKPTRNCGGSPCSSRCTVPMQKLALVELIRGASSDIWSEWGLHTFGGFVNWELFPWQTHHVLCAVQVLTFLRQLHMLQRNTPLLLLPTTTNYQLLTANFQLQLTTTTNKDTTATGSYGSYTPALQKHSRPAPSWYNHEQSSAPEAMAARWMQLTGGSRGEVLVLAS